MNVEAEITLPKTYTEKGNKGNINLYINTKPNDQQTNRHPIRRDRHIYRSHRYVRDRCNTNRYRPPANRRRTNRR